MSSKREGLRTSNLVHRQNTKSHITEVKVARPRDPSDRCWLMSWEQNVLEAPKLVGKLPTPLEKNAPVSSSKVKVARSCDASDRCWLISQERNVLEAPKLVGRFPTTGSNVHQFQGQRSKLVYHHYAECWLSHISSFILNGTSNIHISHNQQMYQKDNILVSPKHKLQDVTNHI